MNERMHASRPAVAGAKVEGLVQFTHLEKAYGCLPGADESRLAAFFDLDVQAYVEIKRRFDERARDSAHELRGAPSFAASVEHVPFGPGQTVLALGDSFTDDLQSWFEIVRHLFDQRRPGDGVRFANAAISGYTTAMALRRLVPTISSRPDWIIRCLGGNDVTRIGPEPNKPTVSWMRRHAIWRRYGASLGHSPRRAMVWITPPTFDEERAASVVPFKVEQSH
jgi:acyl-CoA thioesterase-1